MAAGALLWRVPSSSPPTPPLQAKQTCRPTDGHRLPVKGNLCFVCVNQWPPHGGGQELPMVSDSLVTQLKRQAAVIRRHVIELGTEHVCHVGGALSATDLMTALYFHVLKVDPGNPRWHDRDYFILSKGHCTLALYGALAERGFFPVDPAKP